MNPLAFASKYTDPRIEDLRAAMQNMEKDIPFLLMPVRIETHFAKVTRPGNDLPVAVFDIYQQIDYIAHLVSSHSRYMAGRPMILAALNKTIAVLSTVTQEGVYAFEKQLLVGKMELVQDHWRQLPTQVLMLTDPHHNTIDAQIKALQGVVNQLNVKEKRESEFAEKLIEELELLKQTLQSGMTGARDLEKLHGMLLEVKGGDPGRFEVSNQELSNDTALNLHQLSRIRLEALRVQLTLSQVIRLYRADGTVQSDADPAKWQDTMRLASQLEDIELLAFLTGLDELKQVIYDRKYALMKKANAEAESELRAGYDLMIRIYPDDIAVDDHRKALTGDEFNLGKAYWKEVWLAGGDPDLELAAWRGMCTEVDPPRAAWIAKVLDPAQVDEHVKPAFPLDFAKLNVIRQQLERLGKDIPDAQAIAKDNLWKSYQQQKITNKIRDLLEEVNSLQQAKARITYFFQLQPLFSPIDRRMEAILNKLQGAEGIVVSTQIVAAVDADRQVLEKAFHTLSEVEWLHAQAFKLQHPLDITFPSVSLRSEDVEGAAYSKVLPDRFVAVGIQNGNIVFIQAGAPIPRKLQVGIDPAQLEEVFSDDEEANEFLAVEELAWIFEYPKAVERGMGITVPLDPEDVEGKTFDHILVLGIKETDSRQGQQLLEELLNNHHYADEGMSILPIGAPTNNTEDGNAAFSESGEDIEKSFRIERQRSPLVIAQQIKFDNHFSYEQFEKVDGRRLIEALGINSSVFEHIEGCGGKEISRAFVINQALWYGTGRFMFSQMLNLLFNTDNVRRLQEFFLNHCSFRGILPSLRIGDQPYGLLPTTAFSRLEMISDDNLPDLNTDLLNNVAGYELLDSVLQKRFDFRLNRVIWEVQQIFTEQRLRRAKTNDRGAQQEFMHLLGLQPTSVEYYLRPQYFEYFNWDKLEGSKANPAVIEKFNEYYSDQNGTDRIYAPTHFAARFRQFIEAGTYKEGEAFRILNNFKRPIADLVTHNNLYESILGDGHLEVDALIPVIEDLKTLFAASPKALFELFRPTQPGVAPSPMQPLLFPLVRQSLLYLYYETGLDLLESTYYRDASTGEFRDGMINRLFREQIKFDPNEISNIKFVRNGKESFIKRSDLLFENINILHQAGSFTWGALSVTDNPYYKEHLQQTTLADFLKTNIANKDLIAEKPVLGNLLKTYVALAKLSDYPKDQLKYLVAGHLDSFSHRIDVWTLGLANKKLAESREKQASGILLGAYGWVENLELDPEQNRIPINKEQIPTGLAIHEGEPVYSGDEKDGFIHTPGINHAITAAVLRSGYLSNQSQQDAQNPFSVNLSSKRIRKALQIVEGVQHGAELAAILGYQFERGLHEDHPDLELDQFIYDFRRSFPLPVPVEGDSSTSRNQNSGNPVNGVNLVDAARPHLLTNSLEKWVEELLQQAGKTANSEVHRAIAAEAEKLVDHIDALGDLLLAENVYHMVQGNHVRTAALLQSLAEGDRIPDIRITQLLQFGTSVNHRLILNLETYGFQGPKMWKQAPTERQQVEPALNSWLGQLLGSSEQYRLLFTYKDQEGITQEREMDLSRLSFQPIDLYYLSFSEATGISQSLLKAITYELSKQLEDVMPQSIPEIAYRKIRPDWGLEVKTLEELDLLLKNVRRMISKAKIVGADDLSIMDDSTDALVSEEELKDPKFGTRSFTAPTLIAPDEGRYLQVLTYGHDQSIRAYELDLQENTGYWLHLNGNFKTEEKIQAISVSDEVEIFSVDVRGRLQMNHWFKQNQQWFQWHISTSTEVNKSGDVSGAATTIGDRGTSLNTRLFVRSGDGKVWHSRRIRSGQWEEWQELGGQMAEGTGIAAVESTSGRVDLFIRRALDNGLEQRTWAEGAWSNAWVDLDFTATGDPVALIYKDEQIFLIVPGTNRSLWYRNWQNGQWDSDWLEVPGFILPDGHHFAAVVLEDIVQLKRDIEKRPVVYVFARNENRELYYTRLQSSSWNVWQSLGGILLSEVGVAVRQAGLDHSDRIDIAAWSQDGTIRHIYREDDKWSNWQELAGENEGNHQLRELEARILKMKSRFEDLTQRVATQLHQALGLPQNLTSGQLKPELIVPTSVDVAAISHFLEQAYAFGLQDSLPSNSIALLENQPETGEAVAEKMTFELVRQLLNTQLEIKGRSEKLNQLFTEYEAVQEVSEKMARLQEMAKTVFGQAFVAIPQYRPYNLPEIEQNTRRKLLRHHTSDAEDQIMSDWVQRVGAVRPVLQALDQLKGIVELATNSTKTLDLKPVQLPHHRVGDKVDGEVMLHEDYWLGMAYPPEYEPNEDKISLIMANWWEMRPNYYQNKVGLLLDQWTETIPSGKRTTGAAFHFQTPDAAPPQNLLLAVSPKADGRWEWDDLLQTLLDTLSVAKNRSVEPEDLEDSVLAQVLPGIVIEPRAEEEQLI